MINKSNLMRCVITVMLIASFLSGCAHFTNTVYVPDGAAVRLREEVKNVKVWIKTKDGKIVPGKINLPEGWYCLPMPKGE